MKGLTKEEKRDALGAFFEIEDDRDLAVLDRSVLERWAECPWQARAIEDGRVKAVGVLAEAGEAVHVAFSRTIQSWIDSEGAMSAADLRNEAEWEMRGARPDIQPEALKGGMPALWAWSKLIADIHPGNILRFDGGEDAGRSGQLAYDIPDLGVRVTSELDLLYASPSPEVVDEVDYKTGWKSHTVESIASAFQFQLHALLVFENYKDVNCLRVRVLDSRANRMSYAVPFTRNHSHSYAVRVRSAVEAYKRHHDDPPTWPTVEKCRICPAAALCPVADEPIKPASEDVLRQLIATEARADALRGILTARVDESKQDIVCGGVAFGRSKPPTKRKSPATLYDLQSEE